MSECEVCERASSADRNLRFSCMLMVNFLQVPLVVVLQAAPRQSLKWACHAHSLQIPPCSIVAAMCMHATSADNSAVRHASGLGGALNVPLRFVVQAAQAEAARLQRQAAPPSAHQAPQEMVTTNGEDVRCTSRGGATAEQCKGGRGDGGGDGESEDDGSDRSEGGLSEFGLGGSEGEEEGCDLLEEAASRGARSGGLGASACMSGEAGASEPRCDRPKGGGTCERPSEIGGADTVQQGKGASQEQPQGKAIRGLGARLRMCACYGLMPRSGVFKVFDPAASDGTPKAG
eukprot:1159008-Pelagomonas_calceolata.AAC.8